ncbi:MAG: ABC transporter permease [Spirochaetales bacterium]|nr:ABC transporter permease [Spirochaetales bacterium]
MTEAILVEGLVYGIMALGVFVSFRILDFPDLTAEGAFPLGAATAAALISSGAHPFVALTGAFVAGGLAGAATGTMYATLKVPSLLAGIVVMTGLWSVNLRVLGGKANLPLITNNPVMDAAYSLLPGTRELSSALFFALVTAGALSLLALFFSTEAGIAMGALGDNEAVVVAAGSNPALLRTSGVALSGALCGLSGGLAASYQGFADVNFGSGIVAAGLASVMVGEFLFHSNRIEVQLVRVIIGSIAFRAIMFAGRKYGYLIGMSPNDLRIVTAVLVVGAVAAGRLKAENKARRGLAAAAARSIS